MPQIVADAGAILDEHALQWLADNPGTILATASGERLAVAVDPAKIEQAGCRLAVGLRRFPGRHA